MTQDHPFNKLSPTRLFFRCAIPNMISMGVTSLYVVIDGMFVGNFIGADALAAINLVMPFIMISFALADMVAVGSSVQIAMRLGEGNPREARRIFSFSCLLILGISCLMGLLGYTLAEPLVRLMGADANIVLLAAQYMKVYAVFAPGIMIFFALDNYLRICGKVTYSMLMNILMAVFNIILDWLFIVQFAWGVWSAALASCIALLVGTAVSLFPFLCRKLVLYFAKPSLSPRNLANMLMNGSSELFTNISASLFMLFANAALLQISGSMAVAAFSIVMYIDSLVSALIFGMVDSMQPPISYHYGADNNRRVLALEGRVLLVAALVSLSALCLMLWGSGTLVPLFVEDNQSDLLAMSSRAMYLFSFSYLLSWFGTAASSFFTALNKPRLSLLLACGQSLVFPLTFLLILPLFLGLDGVWLTTLAAELLTSALGAVFLLRVRRSLLRPPAVVLTGRERKHFKPEINASEQTP